jgi:hypothetical protein
MSLPLIQEIGCRNCKHARLMANKALECHGGPPTAFPMCGPDGKGGVAVMGVITVWPQVPPDQLCRCHERGIVTHGVASPVAAA